MTLDVLSLSYLGLCAPLFLILGGWALRQTSTPSTEPLLNLSVFWLAAWLIYQSQLETLDFGLHSFLFLLASITVIVFSLLTPLRLGGVTQRSALTIWLLVLTTTAFVYTTAVLPLFVLFEFLLLLSLNLLVLTSKSERILEASLEMFMWTVAGSAALILAVLWLLGLGVLQLDAKVYDYTTQVIGLALLLGFGVKIPVWPCLSWLLKAHVEASVEFSILLSGFIVKLGLVGLLKLLNTVSFEMVSGVLLGCCVLAMVDAVCRLFAQIDLKRVVALTTVIEMNWLTTCFVFGGEGLGALGLYLAVAHCFTTITEFFIVECLTKRFGTRDVLHVTGLWFAAPQLWYCSFAGVLVTIGFPFTSIFFAKYVYMVSLAGSSLFLFGLVLTIFLLVIPCFFIRLWLPVWFGVYSNTQAVLQGDLNTKEALILGMSLGASVLMGVWPSLFTL